MLPARLITLFSLALLFARIAAAQTVVNSTFQPQGVGNYGDASNWLPAEVPNNSPDRIYDVTIRDTVQMNVDATISNLALTGVFIDNGHSLAVTGHALLEDPYLAIYSYGGDATFSAGSLSSFSGGVLTGEYYLGNDSNTTPWATLQFGGADVTTLSGASLWLSGSRTRVVDEFGNDGLRNLALIDAGSTLSLSGHQTVLAGPFTNDGILFVSSSFDQPGNFAVTGALTNFDPASRTLTGGNYWLGGFVFGGSDQAAVFEFAGADIVHNAALLSITGPLAKITDQNGNDALRNFVHNTPAGYLGVAQRDFSLGGNFTNDGVLSVSSATLSVAGSLTNLDPATRTLTGGTYELIDGGAGPASLIFGGADIVNNAASIYLKGIVAISDENGNDALRNFAHNLKGGAFTIDASYIFTAAADFTNAGAVSIQGFGVSRAHFTVPEGHRYLQTEGETSLLDAIFTGEMEILSGAFRAAGNPNFGDPSILNGNLTIDDAHFFAGPLAVEGAVHLSASSRLATRPGNGGFTVTETFTAAGILQIVPPQNPPSGSDIFHVVSAHGIIGTFSNAPHGARITTLDGGGSFIVSYTPDAILLSGFQAIPVPGQLLNISTRARVGTGEEVAIGGFIISGAQPKTVIVRAIGPSLSSIPGALDDPILELRDSSGSLIASNDNWRSEQEAEIVATALPPVHDLESAIVATLPAFNSAYTAIVRGGNNGTGIGLVEVYDLASTVDSKLANLSTRGLVQTGDNVLIGGLIVLGKDPLNVIVRAIGPSLLPGAVGDPTLSLHDGNGGLIAFNDNWRSDQETEIIATGLPPINELESAIVATLPANGETYTAIVRGQDGTSGIGLIEAYALTAGQRGR